jgi:hypothetical protein
MERGHGRRARTRRPMSPVDCEPACAARPRGAQRMDPAVRLEALIEM